MFFPVNWIKQGKTRRLVRIRLRPPGPVETSDEVIQQYVDRYALKESTPRVYSEIELKALKILQDRARYQRSDTTRPSVDIEAASPARINERSRAEINAIKRRVSRKYESAHDQRHELRSKYGL